MISPLKMSLERLSVTDCITMLCPMRSIIFFPFEGVSIDDLLEDLPTVKTPQVEDSGIDIYESGFE